MIVAVCVVALFATTFAATKRSHKSSTAKRSTANSPTTKSTAVQKTAKSGAKSSGSAKGSSSKARGGKSTKSRRPRGQQAIDSDRAREIQQALIREHYLDGEPTGLMDQRTKDALTRYQNDNGWQSKIVPDARALIKLGLGPSREGLLNPDSAEMSSPGSQSTEKDIPGGH